MIDPTSNRWQFSMSELTLASVLPYSKLASQSVESQDFSSTAFFALTVYHKLLGVSRQSKKTNPREKRVRLGQDICDARGPLTSSSCLEKALIEIWKWTPQISSAPPFQPLQSLRVSLRSRHTDNVTNFKIARGNGQH